MGLPANKPLTIVYGDTFIYSVRRITNTQEIILSGSTDGPMAFQVYSQTTTGLTFGATSDEVQEALRALTKIGQSGVSVGGDGTSGSPYLITFASSVGFPVPHLRITLPAGDNVDFADYLPYDWSDAGWAALWEARLYSETTQTFTGDPIFDITEASDIDVVGRVVFGYLPPTTPAGEPPPPDPTNGVVAVIIPPGAAGTEQAVWTGASARHALQVIRTDGDRTYKLTMYDGALKLRKEPR